MVLPYACRTTESSQPEQLWCYLRWPYCAVCYCEYEATTRLLKNQTQPRATSSPALPVLSPVQPFFCCACNHFFCDAALAGVRTYCPRPTQESSWECLDDPEKWDTRVHRLGAKSGPWPARSSPSTTAEQTRCDASLKQHACTHQQRHHRPLGPEYEAHALQVRWESWGVCAAMFLSSR